MEISVSQGTSQGASQGRSFLARAFDLARPGVVPWLTEISINSVSSEVVSSLSGVRGGASAAEGFSCILSRQIAFPSISVRAAYSFHV